MKTRLTVKDNWEDLLTLAHASVFHVAFGIDCPVCQSLHSPGQIADILHESRASVSGLPAYPLDDCGRTAVD